MDHISGRSQVYLSERGSDELFEGLKALIHQKKCNLVSNFAFKNCGLFSLFSFHGCASGQMSVDAGDTELCWQPGSHKKRTYRLEFIFNIQGKPKATGS